MRMEEVVLVDHYRVLGLPSSGERGGAKLSEEEIRKAYRQKALELHPDKRGGDSSDDFQKLQYSYQILINPVTRHSFHQQQQWFQQQQQHNQYFYTRRQQDEDSDNCFKEQQQCRYESDDDHQEQRDHDRSESDDDQEEEEFRHDQHIHIHNNDHLTGRRHSYCSHHEHININLFCDEQVSSYNNQQQPHYQCSYPYHSPIQQQQQQPHYRCSYPYSSPIPPQPHYRCSYCYHSPMRQQPHYQYLSAGSCHGNHVHCPREECLSQHKEFEAVCRRRLQPSGPHSGFHTTVPQPPRIRRCNFWGIFSCFGSSFIYLSAIFIAVLIVVL